MVITQYQYINVLRMISLLVLYEYIVIISDYMVITISVHQCFEDDFSVSFV